jgi:hypothetical protein
MRVLSRRKWLATTIAALALFGVRRPPAALGADLTVPGGAAEDRFDFDKAGVEGWTVVSGQWTVEDLEGAPSGKKVFVQRATRNEFNVIVAPPGPYTAIDVSMKFKPISGKQDASGGIVFRFADGKYYVVRRQRPGRQRPTLCLRPGATPDRQCSRQAAGPGNLARHARRGRRRPDAGMAQRHESAAASRLTI